MSPLEGATLLSNAVDDSLKTADKSKFKLSYIDMNDSSDYYTVRGFCKILCGTVNLTFGPLNVTISSFYLMRRLCDISSKLMHEFLG